MLKDFSLTLSERLQVIEILPREGNIISLRLIHDLKMKLSPTQQEIHDFKITVAGPGQIQFSAEANLTRKKMTFFPAEIEMIKKQLTDLSNQNKLHLDMIGVYNIFFKVEDSTTEEPA
jgi:predicted PP-loop superfamily ATPase